MDTILQLFEYSLLGFALFLAYKVFLYAKESGWAFSFKLKEFVELSVEPSRVDMKGEKELEKPDDGAQELPADYLFLDHVSFIRDDKQDEFQKRTRATDVPHYDIQVIVNSYYKGALDSIKYVEYFLHKSYPEPIQARSNRANKFLLKELANGEYVLQAKIHFNTRAEPLLLQRYVTLKQDKRFN